LSLAVAAVAVEVKVLEELVVSAQTSQVKLLAAGPVPKLLFRY
jgi:hypothetical protein